MTEMATPKMPRDCGPVQEYEVKHFLAAEAALD
jgi:hypothetical protein